MKRSRLTWHSPAMAVAMLALFVGLGGTAFAASLLHSSPTHARAKTPAMTVTSEKRIAKLEATKVFKSLIAGAHVAFATGATNATVATSSTHASTADSATNATTATHATTADNATLAATATALGSVAYRYDTSAGPVNVPACSSDPCTAEQVGSSWSIATCPSGMAAVGGGGLTDDLGVEISGSFPISWAGSAVPNAWEVTVDNWRQTGSTFNYYVVCATVKTVDNPSGL